MIQDIQNQNNDITINSKQIAVLKEHFPACFKSDGSFDIIRFQEEIKDQADAVHEGYELKFLGKSYAKLLASTNTTTVIQPNEGHNSLPENLNSENIYISGDNLDGLKHLLKSYQKSIKCVYIDPPYNTGSDGFVYQDNFNYTIDTLQERLNISQEEAQRILDLTKRGSASHSAWLMFLYSRLLLTRDLLTDDGVIFISIDDNEQANLKLLCDEVFGEENFVSQLIWQKKKGGGNDSKYIANEHEYILFYSRYKDKLQNLYENYDEKYLNRYKEKDDISRYYWDTFKRKSGKQYYPITCPDGNILDKDEFGNPISWLRSEPRFHSDLKAGEIRIIQINENWSVQFKQRMPEGKKPRSILINNGTTSDGSSYLIDLFKKQVFDNPKPYQLVKYLISIGSSFDDIILDFFSGSATTAHSVMQINADDGGNRKFIAVQLPEKLNINDASQKVSYSFLKENNLPTTLDYIGLERIKRAAKKIKAEHSDKIIDFGFKHYTLVDPNQNTLDKLDSFEKAGLLADTTVLDDFGKPTILATWLNADGYGLTIKPEAINFAGYTAYYCQKHLYLIDAGFTLDSMKALLAKYDSEGKFNPENLVLFGYSFPDWSISEMMEKNLRILNDSEKNLKINYAVRY